MDESNTSNKKQRQSVEKSDTWLKKKYYREREKERDAVMISSKG